ncbi:MAG: hypothetical protein ACI841_000258, partial [Planctomycetota bacterium]
MKALCAPLFLALLYLNPHASAQTFESPERAWHPMQMEGKQPKELTPAFGAALDLAGTWLEAGDADEDDGLDFALRAFELSTNAWVDSDTWAYAILIGDEEEFGLEEAAVHYQGLSDSSTLRAGRFFIDFGKQMQSHIHELPYPERPAVLRAYLGSELAGTGVQFDSWFPTGDHSTLRYSIGVFDSLSVEEHGHGREEEEPTSLSVAEYQQVDEVALTARVSGIHEHGEEDFFQWGLSARHVPEFGFEAETGETGELFARGLDNTVLGFDLTLGFADEGKEAGWIFGAEYLQFTGDLSADIGGTEASPTLDVFDDDASGYYAWIERRWDEHESTGVLFSSHEHA